MCEWWPSNDFIMTECVLGGLALSKKACEILGLLSERLNGKESYGLLHTLVEPVGTPAYKFKDLFFSADGNIRISKYVAYNDALNLLKAVILRTKCLLACAESRKTSDKLFETGDVSFTSLSVEMASMIKELLDLGLRILSEHDFEKSPLSLDVVGSFTCEVANSCSLGRLDPSVFEVLSQQIVNFHMSRPKLYSRKTFTSLFNVLMKDDPEFTSDMECLLAEKQLLADKDNVVRHANSGLVDCHRSITVWLSSVYLGSPYILEHSLTTESELRLLSTLCTTKAFSDVLFRDCTVLLRLIISILRSTPTIVTNNSKGLYGNVKSGVVPIMSVVADAANLLCMIVKLCSQKTAEESCTWNSMEDDEQSHTGLNEFIHQWTIILGLMPSLVESQVSNIPNVVLNAIAEFGEYLFNFLRETSLQRSIIITVLTYCSSNLKSEIRAKAGRALARLIEFKCMSDGLNFSVEAFNAIKLNMEAPEQNIRISFSWAFGNWSDTYLQQYLAGEDSIMEHNQIIDDFYRIISKSNDAKAKVKYNIFRGAANLLKFVQILDAENISKIKGIIDVLLDQVGKGFDFKARWNASCALRNVFTNPCLLNCLDQEMKDRTMQCFIKHMCHIENFKERIQCVVGSASVFYRTIYGDYYMILWDKLVNAAALEPPEFFSEVGQVEKLNIEVGRAYVHLISMLAMRDLSRLEEIVTAKWEGIDATIKLAVASAPLDDFGAFESAEMNLEKIMQNTRRPFELELCRQLYCALVSSRSENEIL